MQRLYGLSYTHGERDAKVPSLLLPIQIINFISVYISYVYLQLHRSYTNILKERDLHTFWIPNAYDEFYTYIGCQMNHFGVIHHI